MDFPASLHVGISLPSNPVPGKSLLCGAAGRHGQKPAYHPGRQTSHQAPHFWAAEGSALSWGTTNSWNTLPPTPHPFPPTASCHLWFSKRPWFQALRGRILIKGKKHIPHLAQLGKNGSYASFSSSSDEEVANGVKNTPKKEPAKVSGGAGIAESSAGLR